MINFRAIMVQVTKLHSLTGHNDAIYALQAGGKENQFFSAGGDGMIVLWDLTQPEIGKLIAKLPNSIYSLLHLNDRGLLVVGHNYEGIHLIDWQNKKEIGSLQLTKSAIFDLQYFNGKILVGTGDGMLTVVDPESLTVETRVHVSEKSLRTLVIHQESGEIAAGFSDHSICVFDNKLKVKKRWTAHHNSVFTLRFTPDGTKLISGSRDARLKVWDATADYALTNEIVAHMYAINHLDFSPDGKHFVTCSMDRSIKVWDASQMTLLKVIDRSRHAGHGTSVNRLLWTNHESQVVSASDDRTLSVWKLIF